MKNNGISINTYGNKNNPSIIFVHGFVYDSAMWLKQITYLSNKYFCVAYDLRGLGNSDVGDGQYTMDSHVDDLISVITFLGLNKPILVGLSMGGYVSLRAIEREESLFSKLVLFDTRSDADTDQIKIKRAANVKQINTEGLDPFLNGFIPNCFSKKFREEHFEQFESFLLSAKRSSPIGVKGCLISMQGRSSTTQYLPGIKIPVLIFCGEHDILSPVEEMEGMAANIQTAEFVVVPDAGHISPVENHTFINKKLDKFLANN
ncbi:MAG TPA: alpha/beta hydrolase [Ignavibacteriaceae bacterium]|jgi:pimeloyl-ACP methyl ester carboxylesterase|nr:alpha/beta hydrolase [Ignavibacteriaceae bacterium]HOJ18669.1 alpha/beta hydrolase [Ignavibacteriaceae bacterium]